MQDSFFVVFAKAIVCNCVLDMADQCPIMLAERIGLFLHSCWSDVTLKYRTFC